MYSIMNRLYKSLKSSQSNKLGEGPFFGPCLWDPENPKVDSVECAVFHVLLQ